MDLFDNCSISYLLDAINHDKITEKCAIIQLFFNRLTELI